jgi:hypothetical protein
LNIFVTSPDPIQCAIALDDIRVIKMILESAQLLSNAIHQYAPQFSPLVYRKCSWNHPCAKWVRESRSNYEWLLKHCVSLAFERLYRTQRVHKTMLLIDTFREAAESIPAGPLTPFRNVSQYPEESDLYLAYKRTLLRKWANAQVIRTRTWTRRPPPPWINGQISYDEKTLKYTLVVRYPTVSEERTKG